MENHIEHQSNCLIQTLEKLSTTKKIIPFSLYTKNGKLFRAITSHKFFPCVHSHVFTLKKMDKNTGCLVLSVLIPIDIEGCPVDLCTDLYSLIETSFCVNLEIKNFCGVVQLPEKLVNRFIPVIEPKC
ncbi:MAG TPA: CotY/CotZ family spore coat protein [Pseudoneobacillus sp.]|nr:CotY/CotZ family spore coat protein [Pseudoneobacillus sp.]